MKPFIGMRILKTALAVTICVMIAQWLRLEYPFYAAIAAIISMESTLTSSFKAGRNRMMGTLVGALVGLAFAWVGPNSALLCGVGIIVIIYVCNRLGWNQSISIAGIVFIAIMVNLNGRSPLLYGAHRIFDTFIGIGVALAVNSLVFPRDIFGDIGRNYLDLCAHTRQMASEVIAQHGAADLASLGKRIQEMETLARQVSPETRLPFTGNRNVDPKPETVLAGVARLKTLHAHLTFAQQTGQGAPLDEPNATTAAALFEAALEGAPAQGESAVVYNYHVRQALAALAEL